MTAIFENSCVQPECPLAVNGTCLEGFDRPQEECPHIGPTERVADPSPDQSDGTVVAVGAQAESSAAEDDSESRGTVLDLGGDEALSLVEGDDLTAKCRCTVVLVAGEFESGKTTLLVELFAKFLISPFADWSFGGSRTLRAFDHRHKTARVSSGAARASTERTQDDDMRLLHLRLGRHDNGRAAPPSEMQDILVSDVRGEFFENVINGGDIAVEVPLADRADCCVVLIDGSLLAMPQSRHEAFFRIRQLVGGLTSPGGIRDGVPLAVICSKADLLPPDQTDDVTALLSDLNGWCESRSLHPTNILVSARPADPSRNEQGLGELLRWITEVQDREATIADEEFVIQGRQFWRKPPEVA